MVIEMVTCIVLWLDSFPSNGGVSTTIIPKGVITGTTLDFKRHHKVKFDAYCQTHEENTTTNMMLASTKGEIHLVPCNKI